MIDYLQDDILPKDKAEARKIKFKASRYVFMQGILFKGVTTYKISMIKNVEATELEEPRLTRS